MTVVIRVPAVFRPLTGGRGEVAATGATVGEVLHAAAREHGDFVRRIITENGTLRPLLNVFVVGAAVRFAADLETPVEDGDEVSIIPTVAGGR